MLLVDGVWHNYNGVEYFWILEPGVVWIKSCVLYAYSNWWLELHIGILLRWTITCRLQPPTWTRTHSRVWVLGWHLPTPTVKLPQACEYAQLLSKFVVQHPFELSGLDVTNMKSSMNSLKKIPISNNNKHHHETILDAYFHNVWYCGDIIIGLYIVIF